MPVRVRSMEGLGIGLVGIGNKPFHQGMRFGRRGKAVLLVQTMSGARCKHEPTQPLQPRMANDRCHEHAAIALASVLLKNEHINEIGECGVVRDHSRIRDLVVCEEQPKIQGILERLADNLNGNAACPSRFIREESMNDADVLFFNGSRDMQ